MRSIALSPDADFRTAQRWTAAELPISLPWHSTLWRITVPALWTVAWLSWVGIFSLDTPETGAILYALAFIGIPIALVLTAIWWVRLFVLRRHTGMLVINDDYLEWQYDSGSEVEMLAACGPFVVAGTRNARIEWEEAGDDATDGWLARGLTWARQRQFLKTFKTSGALWARDVALDRDGLDGLCRLLNQLRDEAIASR